MADEACDKKVVEACCSDKFCTCHKKPNLPCGKPTDSSAVTLESIKEPTENMESANDLGRTESVPHQDASGTLEIVQTNLDSSGCPAAEIICCTCGKPKKREDSSAKVVSLDIPEEAEDTIIIEATIESSEPEASPVEDSDANQEQIGCEFDECDKEFCALQSLPCDKVEEPPVNEHSNSLDSTRNPRKSKCGKEKCNSGRSESQAETADPVESEEANGEEEASPPPEE